MILMKNRSQPMTEKLEQAQDLIESLAARKIGGTGYLMNSEEAELAYEVFNDYVERNELKGVDVKLPFDVSFGSRVMI
jgi:hypothetical protein